MQKFAKEVVKVSIEDELKQSYLDYAMSVIVSRALPDVRDGLKPVHRRILFAMHELNNDYNKPYKKSARIVGDVIGKYHPHGDAAVYESIVRMAQPFSLRYMLVDGQGNFGSVDGDSPAAMRYTEIRLAKIAHEILADLDKETVDFAPNYDGTEFAPVVMPTKIPNLLINGSSGIAVGMATNIPPHNLAEVIDATLALLENSKLDLAELMHHIKGPDFPTAGIINGKAGIIEAYKKGRGKIYVKARAEIEVKGEKSSIIINELPYQVNKAKLQEKIVELVKEKRIDGITAIRDESDKKGMRVVIELRRGENAEVILNNLFSLTQMQVTFGINMVALDAGQPKLMGLKEILQAFIDHRRDVVTKRTIFELKKAKNRAHILEGLGIALVNIDPIVALIKSAKNSLEAKEKLMAQIWKFGNIIEMLKKAGTDVSHIIEGYKLSEIQAQAILDMKLHRLTGLEQEKIINEFDNLLKTIIDLKEILENPERLQKVIYDELLDIKNRFSDERRTEIIVNQQELTTEDFITEQDVVVTFSSQGYAKIQPLSDYSAQRRGGKGKTATKVKDEDFVEHLVIANTHDTILCFSNFGKVYWLKVYNLPQGSRISKGKPIVNLLSLEKNEKINSILPIRDYEENKYVFMATSKGVVKKSSLKDFSRPRANGIIAVNLDKDDYLIGASITDGNQEVMLFSDAGKVTRFSEKQVRNSGRISRGIRGIRLANDQKVISLLIAKQNGSILTATEKGFGKRTKIDDYSKINRGGKGVISIIVNQRNGKVIGAVQVYDGEDILLISDQGILVRTRVDEVSVVGRNTQGVRLITLGEGEQLIGLQRVEVELEDS